MHTDSTCVVTAVHTHHFENIPALLFSSRHHCYQKKNITSALLSSSLCCQHFIEDCSNLSCTGVPCLTGVDDETGILRSENGRGSSSGTGKLSSDCLELGEVLTFSLAQSSKSDDSRVTPTSCRETSDSSRDRPTATKDQTLDSNVISILIFYNNYPTLSYTILIPLPHSQPQLCDTSNYTAQIVSRGQQIHCACAHMPPRSRSYYTRSAMDLRQAHTNVIAISSRYS